MQCPKCGYELSAFEAECPRCKRLSPPVPPTGGPPPPPTAFAASAQQVPPPPPAFAQPAHSPREVPEDVRSITFLWAAFLWNWVWCIGNRVWWALYWFLGFVVAQIVLGAIEGFAGAALRHHGSGAAMIPLRLLSSAVNLANLVFGIWFAATRAPEDAWNARPFRDSMHFRQTQHVWLIVWIVLSAICIVIVGGIVAFVVVMIARHGFPG